MTILRIIEMIGVTTSTFIVTNLDDILLLALFYSHSISNNRILKGQILGMSFILLLSVMTAELGETFLPSGWVRFLGIFPLMNGLTMIFNRKKTDAPTWSKNLSVLGMSSLTLSHGGDNIAIYGALFAESSPLEVLFYTTGFLALTAIICMNIHWGIGRLKKRGEKIKFLKKWIPRATPLILIALGILILIHPKN